MNPRLNYLNNLYQQNMIDRNAYLSGLQNAYRFSPSSFSEEDIDFIEKRLRNADISFNRDLGMSEQSIGSMLINLYLVL